MRTSVIALALCIGAITLGAACPDRSGQSESAANARVCPAPDSFRVDFETSRGKFSVDVLRSWAPKGADRFYDLVQDHFFDGAKFFRVVPGFVVQFGLNADPKRNERWLDQRIADDPVSHSNLRGTLTFATEGPNTRAHQLFINLVDNARLDRMGFAPIGRVIDGMTVVDSLYSEYGEAPDQHMIQTLGNSYLERMFPKLDYIKTARIEGKP
jgi:peptidyl-prolyl cis-trans isomerase A (cyclophilin A)